MFGSLGVPELMLIFAVILIVFGPRKLPEIGRTLGKAMGEFRKATDDLKSTIEREVRLEELKQIAPPNLKEFTAPFDSVSASLESLSMTELSAMLPRGDVSSLGVVKDQPQPELPAEDPLDDSTTRPLEEPSNDSATQPIEEPPGDSATPGVEDPAGEPTTPRHDPTEPA